MGGSNRESSVAKRHGFVRRGGAVLALSFIAMACGSTPPPKVAPPAQPKASVAPPPADVHERIAPHVCGSRAKLAQLLGQNAPAPAPAPPSEQTAESAPPPTSLGANTRLAGNQAYRVVAPGTVLIRSERGMGSGVVIDPRGYILTNNHVIADGQQKDFVIKVNVTFGDLTPTGRMSRQEKNYEGVVVKVDAVRDLAIVHVKDAPPKLTAVKLAKSAPQIAEKVISVGHAGIGFLWAAKTCNVASIGERQQDSSMLAGMDCSLIDPADSPDKAARQKKSCDEQKKMMTDAFSTKTQGLAVQTDCAITHGDSGGPLVNAAGEIVGLNQSISADLATAAFHVHLDELREFVSKFSEEGIPILPDPFCDGGFNPTLEDIDLDGIPETLVTRGGGGLFGGYDRMGILIDLDQDHYARKKESLMPFDADIALLVVRDTAYVWYDTDNDARFDLLLVDKGNDGQPESAYRIDAEGRIKEDKEALPKHDFSAKFVKDKSLHARLGKIAAAIGGTKYVSSKTLAAGSQEVTVPEPATAVGTTGRLVDTDGNGKSDMIFARGTFSRGLLIDADEDTLGTLKPGESADEILKAKKVDAELAVVVQGSNVWALYDTNNDSKFDLALMTSNGTDESWLYTTNAWRLGRKGEMTPAPEQVGRKLVRPRLVSFPRAVTAFRGSGFDIASDEEAGSLPDPFTPKGGTFRVREVKGFPRGTVIEAESRSGSAILVDLDGDTKLGAKDEPQKAVKDGKFDAEVAIVHRGESDWIYYDTDADKKFDLVLFVPKSGQDPTQAFRIGRNASGAMGLEVESKSIAGRPLRHKSVFKDKAMAAKWKVLAGKIFKSTSVEE